MRMKPFIVCVFFVAVLLAGNKARCESRDDVRSLFYKGNARYAEGKFEEAATDYEHALHLGYESAPLYYNLGNAYFKQGSLGKAILNYIRARRLMPRDADIQSNLTYARSLIQNGFAAPQQRWYARLFRVLADFVSLDEITLVCELVYLLICVMTVLSAFFARTRKAFGYAGAPLVVLLALSLSLFAADYREEYLQNRAIIIAEKSDCRFEPFDDATTHFALHEGECVDVLSSKAEWIKIRRIDGKQGWIRLGDIELL
jgi:tetratricopeptide (TPR) repeat protein